MIHDGLTKHERYRLKDLDAYRKRKREWAKTPDQKAKRLEYSRKWRALNRDLHNERAKINHQKYKHKYVLRNANYALMFKYGIGLEFYNFMLARQSGGCFLCGRHETTRRLHVDHDHATGQVRKLLCMRCNTHLGWVEQLGLQKIKDYLEMNHVITDGKIY